MSTTSLILVGPSHPRLNGDQLFRRGQQGRDFDSTRDTEAQLVRPDFPTSTPGSLSLQLTMCLQEAKQLTIDPR